MTYYAASIMHSDAAYIIQTVIGVAGLVAFIYMQKNKNK